MNGPGFDWLNRNSSFDSSDSYVNNNSRTKAPQAPQPTPSISFQQASTSNGFIPVPPPRQHTSSAHLFPETSISYRNNNSVDDINSRHASASAIIHGSYGESFDSVLRSRHDSIMSVNEQSIPDNEQNSYIPLSLTAQDLTLQESKTYMRWYSDILARTSSRTITMNDVYTFLNNFKIPSEIKEKVNRIFSKILYSINIGEFFALLRVISHTLQGKEPSRYLITIEAPVPTPPSILSKKRQNDDDYDDANESIINDEGSELNSNGSVQDINKPLDIDSFTQFLLTGERPDEQPKKRKSKKLKSVKFSDQVDIHDDSFANSPGESPQPQDIDYSLPMDQLLNRIKSQPRVPPQSSSNQLPTLSQLQQQQQQQQKLKEEEEEREILKDMESQINHFQNLHSVDTVSIGGVPSSIHLQNSSENLLRPNMTGPAQMARMFSPSPEPELLQPNMTGPTQMAQYLNRTQNDASPLMPNITGPADMARIFAPSVSNAQPQPEPPKISLQSFTSQMTGNTMENTLQNSQIGQEPSFSRPLPPIPARNRSSSSPTPTTNGRQGAFPPPVPPRSPLSRVPPPPPPSRRRNASMQASNSIPPPLPPKVPQGGVIYQSGSNDSTSNILDDLKALQEEVDKIRDMTGGF